MIDNQNRNVYLRVCHMENTCLGVSITDLQCSLSFSPITLLPKKSVYYQYYQAYKQQSFLVYRLQFFRDMNLQVFLVNLFSCLVGRMFVVEFEGWIPLIEVHFTFHMLLETSFVNWLIYWNIHYTPDTLVECSYSRAPNSSPLHTHHRCRRSHN